MWMWLVAQVDWVAAVVVLQEVTAAVLVTLVAPQTPVILSQVSVMDTKSILSFCFTSPFLMVFRVQMYPSLDLSNSPVNLIYGSRNPNSRCINWNTLYCLLLAKECRMCYFHWGQPNRLYTAGTHQVQFCKSHMNIF